MNSHLPQTAELASDAIEMLETLVSFDTTSRNSNLELIAFVQDRLRALGVKSTLVASPDGKKSNLFATLGPFEPGGVVLSGHTDVVPVDGQRWSSDPFSLTRRGTRLHGRGTCDMKSFLALALAATPLFARDGQLRKPIHLAFSYDEEVGCLGAPAMIEQMALQLPTPAAAIVGEPTNMEVVSAQKGACVWRVTVCGHEAHSSQTHLGLSANMVAVRLMARLAKLAEELEREPHAPSPFCPAHPTLTIGQIEGGTAPNILARQCQFVFDLRCPADTDPEELVAPFFAEAGQLSADMKKRFANTGVEIERLTATPPLAEQKNNPAELLARSLLGDNGPMRGVSYAAEAGQFQQAGFPTIICGPGSIAQAHQPDEYIEQTQVERGAEFMLRLAGRLAS